MFYEPFTADTLRSVVTVSHTKYASGATTLAFRTVSSPVNMGLNDTHTDDKIGGISVEALDEIVIPMLQHQTGFMFEKFAEPHGEDTVYTTYRRTRTRVHEGRKQG